MQAAVKITEETKSVNSLEEPRFERIFGTEYAMSSPSYKHQSVLLAIGAQLKEKLKSSDCKTIVAPFDVYPLYDKGDKFTLVQPDVFLACDSSKLKDNRYNGAPKFIIETLSSIRHHDMVTKLNLYEKAGVNEYWMIDPEEQIIIALVLAESLSNSKNSHERLKVVKWNGKYIHHSYSGESEVPLVTIPGCIIDFKKVFEE